MFSAPVTGVTLIAVVGVLAGVLVTSLTTFARRLVPFGGGILLGIAVFWILPEMAEYLPLPMAIGGILAGFVSLWAVDRYVYPVCPACSPAHDHEHCETRLHGFATPLLLAAALHSALDGWSLAAAGEVHLDKAFLAGIVNSEADRNIAFIRANGVPGVFSVTNDLRIER